MPSPNSGISAYIFPIAISTEIDRIDMHQILDTVNGKRNYLLFLHENGDLHHRYWGYRAVRFFFTFELLIDEKKTV